VVSLRALASYRNSSTVLLSTSVCGLPNFQTSFLTGSSALYGGIWRASPSNLWVSTLRT